MVTGEAFMSVAVPVRTERIGIGRVVLLVAHHAQRQIDVEDMLGMPRRAVETPAVVAGPQETLLELAHHRWDDGGQVVCRSRTDSAPAFDRLLHGARLGVQDVGGGTDACEVRLLHWEPGKGWGNVRKATREQLDHVLEDDVADLLIGCGALDLGTKEEVLFDDGRRRNDLAATFPAGDPVVPLAVYTVTRVLPIIQQSLA
jgi:hypothetical protein